MALYNEILAGRFNRFVQKHFSMKGREGMPTLAADLQVNIQLWSEAENAYLEGWDLFGSFLSNAANAAGAAGQRLRNPAGSGVIAYLERYSIASSVAENPAVLIEIFPTTVDYAVIQPVPALDGRGRAASTLVLSKTNAATAGVLLSGGNGLIGGFLTAAANAIGYDLIQDPRAGIPILPGRAVNIVGGVVNDNLAGTVRWRERALESSELT